MISINTDISAIYCIFNILDNKMYIGSAKNLRIRLNNHDSQLSKDKHHSIHLQYAYNKYGPENFKIAILAKCPPEYLIKLEQWFINSLKPEYNICKVAGSTLGVKTSDDAKNKNRNAHLGKKLSKETISKIVEQTRKIIYRYDLDGNYIDSFKGVRLAGDTLGIDWQRLVNCAGLKTGHIQAGNFQWRYYKVDKLPAVEANRRDRKKLIQLTTDNKVVKIWSSATQAARTLNLNPGNLMAVARGNSRSTTTGGYKWAYDISEHG